MKKVKQTLTVLFWTFVTLALLIVVLFETETLEVGFCTLAGGQTEFLLTMLMELLTLAMIPLALKLFKFKRIHSDLTSRKSAALGKWGILRLLMLLVPLLANTLLYYAYANTTFGYMAIILVIVLPFVYPSMGRCVAETTEEQEQEA